MSSIFVEMGQCGCQIGNKLNNKLSSSYYSTRIHNSNKIHAIMIDTQSKVLKPLINNTPSWLDVANIKYFQHGRGNNWSYGYLHSLPKKTVVSQFVEGHRQFSHLTNKERDERRCDSVGKTTEIRSQRQSSVGKTRVERSRQLSKQKQRNKNSGMKKSQQQLIKTAQNDKNAQLTPFEQKVLIQKYFKENRQISEFIINKIHKELDYCDCPSAINVLCSLGGGTGSGLGTKIIQQIYQEFNMDIFAHVVLPNKSGQTPLQIYNCALSLSTIQNNCTAIFTYENDNMINTFLESQKNEQGEIIPIKGTDLDYINEQISQIQARFFKINDLPSYPKFYQHIASECIISNQLKYLTLFGGTSTNGNNYQIQQMFDNCFQMVCQQLKVYNQEMYQIDGVETRRGKCLANSMVVFAQNKYIGNKVEIMDEQHRRKLKNIINPVEYNSGLNIQYAALPKTVKQNANCNMKVSKMSNVNAQSLVAAPCQISFVMNHSNIIRYLQYLTVSGRKKYQAKAYLWHYKYADLENAFENLQRTVDQYYYASQP